MYKIKSAIPDENYNLHLEYEDGTKWNVNLSNLVGKWIFTHWDNIKNFLNIKIVQNGRAIYRNDNIDMCADSLWIKITNQNPYLAS